MIEHGEPRGLGIVHGVEGGQRPADRLFWPCDPDRRIAEDYLATLAAAGLPRPGPLHDVCRGVIPSIPSRCTCECHQLPDVPWGGTVPPVAGGDHD